MPRFDYHDKNGESAIGACVDIDADVSDLTISVGMEVGDSDAGYTIYVPNHRTAVAQLIADLQAVLDASEGTQPLGFDQYCGNAWYSDDEGNENCS